MNPSTWHPQVRTAIYIVLTVAGLAYGSGMAYLGATGTEPPLWLVGAGAVYAYLAAATGLMAAQNTPDNLAAQQAQQEVEAIGGIDPDAAWRRPEGEPMAVWVEPETLPQRARDDDGDGVPDVAP